MRDALQRFATGTYAVWYPLARSGAKRKRCRDNCGGSPRGDWLDVALQRQGAGCRRASVFTAAACSSSTRRGSSRTRLRDAMPVLVEALGQDAAAAFKLEFRQT